MLLKQLTTELLEKLMLEIKKTENMTKIQLNFIDPIIKYSFHRLYPYILISAIIFLLTFILALAIFILVINSYFNNKVT